MKELSKYDIICIQEAKINIYDFEHLATILKHEQLCITINCRPPLCKGGGLAIIYKSRLKESIRIESSNSSCFQAITLPNPTSDQSKPLLIANVYIPPSNSKFINTENFEHIETQLVKFADKFNMIVCGDFNAHTADENDFVQTYSHFPYIPSLMSSGPLQQYIPTPRKNYDKTSINAYGKSLLRLCKSFEMLILNGRSLENSGNKIDFLLPKPTTKFGTTIDYFLASNELVRDGNVSFSVHDFDCIFSDVHCIIESKIEFNHICAVEDYDDTTGLDYYQWVQAKQEIFVENINLMRLEEIKRYCGSQECDIDNVVDAIREVWIDSVKTSFRKRKKKNRSRSTQHKPWFNQSCKIAQKKYYKARRKNYRTSTPLSRSCLVQASKLYAKTLKAARLKQRHSLHTKLRQMKSKKPKDFFSLLETRKQTYHNKQPSAEDFAKYFKQLTYSDKVTDDNTNTECVELNMCDDGTATEEYLCILNNEITESEILQAIGYLKNGKSTGIDNIRNEYIKSTVSLFLPIYYMLFNKILDEGRYPSSWLFGTILPLFKNKGERKSCNNYRGITLLSCFSKLFTSILNKRLNVFIETTEQLSEYQSGFRSQHSTLDNCFVLSSLIMLYKRNKKKLYCAIVDYAKAFDTVCHSGLWYKLRKCGIKGNFINVLYSMYKGIKSCVQSSKGRSDFFPCNIGVRQGENLSPLLFSIFINDLETFW